MGGRGSWSSSSEGTFDPRPGGLGKGDDENVLGPRIPSTLSEALGAKGRPMGPGRASKGTNPYYNPKFDAYSSNCQRCVIAYEARRRGYDVMALPTYKGDLLPRGRDYMKALSNPKTVDVGKSVDKLKAEMHGYGDGARAIVTVRKGRNGHAFIAENSRGKTVFIDPQTNSRYSGLTLRHVSNASVTRIDNQGFTEYARNAFTQSRR